MLKTQQPKFVVLDANVFISDYWLRSPSFLLLRDFLGKTGSTLVVPKIALEEVINHYEEDLGKLKLEARASAREAARLLRDVKSTAKWLVDLTRSASVKPYEGFLSTELGKLRVQIPTMRPSRTKTS